jgi:hypothetical protein
MALTVVKRLARGCHRFFHTLLRGNDGKKCRHPLTWYLCTERLAVWNERSKWLRRPRQCR